MAELEPAPRARESAADAGRAVRPRGSWPLAIPLVAFASCGARSTTSVTPTPTAFLVVGVAIVVGVGGVFFLYWAMNRVVDLLPARFREGVRPYVFVGPALVILSVFLSTR